MTTPTSDSSEKIVEVTEELAKAIEELADIGKKLMASRLKSRTVLLLLRDLTGLGMKEIELVLCALPVLETNFLKPKKKA